MFFITGESIDVEENVHEAFFEALRLKADWTTIKDLAINLDHVTHILPLELIENADSGVVRQKTPAELKDQAEKDRLRMIENPQALLQDIRQKADSDNEPTS